MPIHCTKCGELKPDDQFKRNSRQCRPCVAEYMRNYALVNRERLSEYKTDWARRNPEKAHAACERWRSKNREFEKQRARDFRSGNQVVVGRYNEERRTTERLRTPNSLSEQDRVEIERCYERSALYRGFFGIDTHVDHIIPLRGKRVSGLHVPWNLRITTAFGNRTKHVKWLEAEGVSETRTFEDEIDGRLL